MVMEAHFQLGPQFFRLSLISSIPISSNLSRVKAAKSLRRLLRSKMASGLSNGTRLFRGCRTLLDSLKSAAKASSSAAATSPKSTASKPKGKNAATEVGARKEVNRSSGIFKSVQVSPALGSFLGMSETSRSEAVKQIWSYIKLHNLQSPADKREINCDEKLKTIFDGREKVGFLEIGKLLSPHFVKSN